MDDAKPGAEVPATDSPTPDPAVMAASLSPEAPFPEPAAVPRTPERRARRPGGAGGLIFSLVLVAVAVLAAGLALSGGAVKLPVWAVAEAEARLNRAMASGAMMPGASVALGGLELALGRDGVPRLVAEDLRLLGPGGGTMAQVPQLQLTLDGISLATGHIRPATLRLAGAQFRLRRLADGRFDLSFGAPGGPAPGSIAEILDQVETAFARPELSKLRRIDAEAMTLTLDDMRAGRVWQVGDGQVTLQNGNDEIALGLGFGLTGDGGRPARADMTLVSVKASRAARLTVAVDGVSAADLAAQAPALAWLGALDAPISGWLAGGLDTAGQLGPVEGGLKIGAGALQPTPETRPLAIDGAGLRFRLDAAAGRLSFSDLSVQGPALRLSAEGQTIAADVTNGLPRAFLAQVGVRDLQVDPAGLFQEPVRFSQGAIDLRLTLDPFRVEIGQLALREQDRRLLARGSAAAGAGGWSLALDLSLNEIPADRLLALWPVALVTPTRNWLIDNVEQGLLFDVQAAVRVAPGTEPKLSLGYEFADTDVRVVRTLPPVRGGYGYATIQDLSYTIVLDRGQVTPPMGGPIDVAGSVLRVGNIRQHPAIADLSLRTESSITSALSLLDEPPFQFLTKAGRAVDVAEGRASTRTRMRFPLVPRLMPDQVDYAVAGRLGNAVSDRLVPGRTLRAATLDLQATPAGMTISGKGTLDGIPFDGAWTQPFGADVAGSTASGTVELSPRFLDTFRIGLPQGSVQGSGTGSFTIGLPRSGPSTFRLTSDLRDLALRLAPVGWSKGRDQAGALAVQGRFTAPPVVDSLTFTAPGLSARGTVTLRPSGDLDLARFSNVTLRGWLNAAVDLRGRGAGRDVAVAVTGGSADIRKLPGGAGGPAASGGPPLAVALDRLTVSDGIALTGFRGSFTQAPGFAGDFTARVNGGAAVRGSVVPAKHGTAVRIRSDDAGGVIEAAGIFDSARGGNMDMTLTPRAAAGEYDGRVTARSFRVVNAPILAELLSAISVVGLLEQMGNAGLTFSDADADFVLTPRAVEVTRAAAVGASLGVSMAGLYDMATGGLRMQGVISPIYMLNGIGSLISKRGEGLFGFNYSLTGTADAPVIGVNPLSLFTPGMFREVFRRPPPRIGNGP